MTTREKELTELVRSLEWHDPRYALPGSAFSPEGFAQSCPCCGGVKPDDPYVECFSPTQHGHRPGCRLVAGLGEGATKEGYPDLSVERA